MKDTARVLGRMYDGIEYRGFGQAIVEELAAYAGVPVYNGLTDEFHPTQILADFLTMREHTDKHLSEIAYCFVGDAGNNMGNSLMVGGGDDRHGCAPRARPRPVAGRSPCRACQGIAGQTGARIMLTEDVEQAVAGCDYVYTDVWVSMGEPDSVWAERIAAAQALSGQRRRHGSDRQSSCQVHALPAGVP